jgi:hypothetical protein
MKRMKIIENMGEILEKIKTDTYRNDVDNQCCLVFVSRKSIIKYNDTEREDGDQN